MTINPEKISINNIPACLWGKPSEHMFIAVHGNMSSKSDTPIAILAEEAIPLNYQVLSFDLPEHGDRAAQATTCTVENCINDLNIIMNYAKTKAKNISLFACSMGAYFSLLAYKNQAIEQSLFLSPVVNMERIIMNMMAWFNISEESLKAKGEILTPIGQKLYWDYYQYVKANPITTWDSPTAMLYGENDDMCDYKIIADFSNRFDCDLNIMSKGEHYFHTPTHLAYFRQWLKENLKNRS